MEAKLKAEQDVLSAADCWARGVLQSDRLLDLSEQNLLDAVMALDRILKREGTDPSHLPPPPNIPHDIDIEDEIPTVRYSKRITVPSKSMSLLESEEESDSDDIF